MKWFRGEDKPTCTAEMIAKYKFLHQKTKTEARERKLAVIVQYHWLLSKIANRITQWCSLCNNASYGHCMRIGVRECLLMIKLYNYDYD